MTEYSTLQPKPQYIFVDKYAYIRSHGKDPKSCRGRGYWAFDLNTVTFFFHGTFTEALRDAKAAAQYLNVRTIVVLP